MCDNRCNKSAAALLLQRLLCDKYYGDISGKLLTRFFGRVELEKMRPNVLLQLGVVFELRAVCLQGRRRTEMSVGMRFAGWPHVVYSQQFSREWIEGEFFPLAREMREVFRSGGSNLLRGKRMVTLFYQPSTRTRGSFQMAMSYLGGEVPFATENAKEFSSAEKGESLEHSVKVWNCYRPDVIILRHNEEGAAEIAAKVSNVPVINAGDGPGQHPTQAFLDIFTIQEKLESIDGVSVVINGDLAKNRAARSLVYLLSKFKGVRIFFVSPPERKMRQDVLSYLCDKGVDFTENDRLEDVIHNADVVYMLRTPREYGSEVSADDDNCVLDERKASLAKKSAIFMHPLPIDSRVNEIRPEIEKDPRSVFLTDQIESGICTRMALLSMVMIPKQRHAWLASPFNFGLWIRTRQNRKAALSAA